jgi:hypothetical protein
VNDTLAIDDWQVLVSIFPKNWKELAKSTKAITRKFRSFENEESVMRALLTHIANGYSLRETVTRLKHSKLADISDVALLKRLQCSELWLRELCLCLFQERGVTVVKEDGKIRMRLVDGTSVKEPGKTGSLWKIHYSMTLPNLSCDYFKLTSDRGKGTGESFKQFPIQKGDCIVGDRGYSTSQGINYLVSNGAHALVRVNTSALSFQNLDSSKFTLLTALQGVEQEGSIKEWHINLIDGDQLITGRLCVIRKSKMATEQALKKLKRRESKSQMDVKAETIEFSKYVILFTTLPSSEYPLEIVLEWYRYRWQIELVFKRLKSLVGLGHLPKHDETSARAWLYGKLFTGLLIEKLIYQAKNISPWGYVE